MPRSLHHSLKMRRCFTLSQVLQGMNRKNRIAHVQNTFLIKYLFLLNGHKIKSAVEINLGSNPILPPPTGAATLKRPVLLPAGVSSCGGLLRKGNKSQTSVQVQVRGLGPGSGLKFGRCCCCWTCPFPRHDLPIAEPYHSLHVFISVRGEGSSLLASTLAACNSITIGICVTAAVRQLPLVERQ